MNTEASFYLKQLEGDLKAAIELHPTAEDDLWLLVIPLSYDGDPAGTKSFNLHGYAREEAEAVARDIQANPFVMKEIDEFLWGESD